MSTNWDELQRQASANRQARDAQRARNSTPGNSRFMHTGPANMPVQNAVAVPIAVSTESFWNQNPGGLSPLITEDMKDAIAYGGVVFRVNSITWNDNPNAKFGPHWMTQVEVDGQHYGMAFGSNMQRDGHMEQMKRHIEQYGPIEATLTAFETQMGTGYNLAPPPNLQQSDGIVHSTTNTVSTDTASPYPDDVPF